MLKAMTAAIYYIALYYTMQVCTIITFVTQILHGHVCTLWQHDVFVAGHAQCTGEGHW